MSVPARRILLTCALAAVSLVAIGAAQAAPPAPSSASPATALAHPARAAESIAVPAPVLEADVARELDAILAAETSPAARTDRTAARGALRRLAAFDRLVHGTVVVDLKDGGLTTIQLDHGTISAVGATSITIAEAGGGSVTVGLGSETRVRRAAAKAAIADLKPADRVFVMSKVEAGGTTAYLVVVPHK